MKSPKQRTKNCSPGASSLTTRASGAWLRAVAVRLALNLKRQDHEVLPAGDFADRPLAAPDPELALLRAQHRHEFSAAFEEALRTLTPRDRTLLRLTSVDGLTLAQVGQMYGKDTSTVSRWVAAVREALRLRTREVLKASLALGTDELESVLRAADSELHLSLARLL